MPSKYKNVAVTFWLLLVMVTNPQANASVNFAKPATYPAGPNPGQVITGDFNGDGKLDMAVLNPAISPSSTGSVAILLGNGDGSFQPATQLAIASSPDFIAAADLDGDHKLDLVVATAGDSTANTPAAILLLRGKGDGSFQDPEDLHLEFVGAPLVVGDFNGDGIPDLVVATIDTSGNDILVSMLGSGNARLTPVDDYGVGQGAIKDLRALDVNGDQQLDLVVGTLQIIGSEVYWGGTSVLLGKGNGRFENPVVAGAGAIVGLLWGDFAENQPPDIVAGYSKPNVFGRPSVGLLVNNGKGIFTPGFSVASAAIAGVGDFDGDGKLDLAVVPLLFGLPSEVELFLGNGDHTFQAPITVSVPIYDPALVVDLNADGVADLVLEGNSGLTVLLNQTPSFTFLANSPMSATANAGGTASYTLQPVAHNGFDGMVAVSCSTSAPKAVSCSVSPTSVSPGQSFTVKVSTTAPTSAAAGRAIERLFTVWLLVPGVLIGVVSRRRFRPLASLLVLGVISLLLLQANCGGGGSQKITTSPSGGTTAGAYAITVTGGSGASVSHASLILTVQ